MAHILLVEGDEGIRDALDFVLTDSGYHVTAIGSAQEALTILQTEHAAAVVVLVNQRQRTAMSGVDLYDAVARSLVANPHNAFIIMSTSTDEHRPVEITELLTRANIPIMTLPATIDAIEALVDMAADHADQANADQSPTDLASRSQAAKA